VLGVWQELNVVMYDLEIRLVSTFFLLFGLKPFDLFTLFYINARTAKLLRFFLKKNTDPKNKLINTNQN